MEKHIFIKILTWLVICVLSPLFSKTWVNIDHQGKEGASPEIVTLVSNSTHTIIDVTIPGMWRSKVSVQEDTFDILEIPGYPSSGKLGQAQIPIIGKLIGIPPYSNVTLIVENADSAILTDFHIYPVQNIFYPDPDTFFYDEEFYNTNAFSPGAFISISEPYLWHDCRIVEFPINPVRYNPVSGELRVYSNIRIRLHYWGTSNQNVQTIPRNTITPERARMYRDMIVNFDFLGFTERADVGARYLIITDQYFSSAIENLRAWKHKKGIATAVAYLDNDVARNDSAIHNYIKNFFKVSQALGNDVYVLLVGNPENTDEHYLPMHNYIGTEIYSDHYYTCVYGHDLYPDVQLGRISPAQMDSVEDARVVEMIANRTVDYETNPPIGSWVKDYVVVNYWGFSHELKDYITNLLESYPGVTISRLYGDEGATNDMLRNEINEGTGILNYFGHGLPQEWPPEYAIDLGQPSPSPITVQRDGYIEYGTEPYQTSDYDFNKLVYHITGIEGSDKWTIKFILYHEGSDKLKERIRIDDGWTRNEWVEPYQLTKVEGIIPEAFIMDGEITITIEVTKGQLAILSGIILERESKGQGGGPQSTISIPQRLVFSLKVFPNLIKHNTQLQYTIPIEQRIILNLYDVAGRKVATIAQGITKPGVYSHELNSADYSQGIYFLMLEGEKEIRVEKLLVIR